MSVNLQKEYLDAYDKMRDMQRTLKQIIESPNYGDWDDEAQNAVECAHNVLYLAEGELVRAAG